MITPTAPPPSTPATDVRRAGGTLDPHPVRRGESRPPCDIRSPVSSVPFTLASLSSATFTEAREPFFGDGFWEHFRQYAVDEGDMDEG